jgi:hypothetical protein
MTEIMVSKRDGIAKGPDGTKYRVARGKTLADAAHPVVVAYPNDWQPMRVELSVESPGVTVGDVEALEELRNELAEMEETAQVLSGELTRLLDGLMARGYKVPAEDDREAGWLVEFALGALDQARTAATTAADVAPESPRRAEPVPALAPAPRPPRAAKVKPPANG